MIKPPNELSDDDVAAISEIVPGVGSGQARVKFYDKKAALDAIARHLGMFPLPPRRHEDDSRSRSGGGSRVNCLHASSLASLPEPLRNKLVRSLTPDQALKIMI